MAKKFPDWVSGSADVSTAFLHALSNRSIFVTPPKDLYPPGTVVFWRLKRSLYGCRDSPKNWSEHLMTVLDNARWTQSAVDWSVYFPTEGAQAGIVVVHVDDLYIIGRRAVVEALTHQLQEQLLIKVSEFQTSSSTVDLEFLGRKTCRRGIVYSYHGDEQVIRKSLEELGLESCKDVTTPGVGRNKQENEDETLLNDDDKHTYMKHCGPLLYIAQDRSDCCFAVKEISRRMINPRPSDMEAIKRCFRYLSSRMTLTYEYDVDETDGERPLTYVDNDRAGCQESRKSTSGILVTIGKAPMVCSSRTRSVVALSSAESEIMALAAGCQEALFIRTLLVEAGFKVAIPVLYSDSQPASDALKKGGVGRMKHMGLRCLFINSLVHDGILSVYKIRGEVNPADFMTKHIDQTTRLRLMTLLSFKIDWKEETRTCRSKKARKGGDDEEMDDDD